MNQEVKIRYSDYFNADTRKSNADTRRFTAETICDHLRAICDNLRSEKNGET